MTPAERKALKIRAYQAAMRSAGYVESAIWIDAGLVDAVKNLAKARGLTLRELVVDVLTRAVKKRD